MTRHDRFFWSPDDITDAQYNGWGLKETGALKIIPKLNGFTENRFALQYIEKIGEKRPKR